MLSLFRKIFPDRHPIRLFYHKLKAIVAALVYLFPADKLIVIGVTGTNGKTTTVNMIVNVLNASGAKVGMTSTAIFQIGSERWVNTSKQTTMSPFVLQKMLKRMVKEGCKYAVLEVSSHAMIQSRVLGVNIDVGVITNVTEDHIEYHGSFNNYLNAKGSLFKKISRGKRKVGVPKILILNSDDKYYSYFNQFVADRKITYGFKAATCYAAEIKKKPEGSHFTLHVPNNAIEIELHMPGEFNVYNALAASAVGMALNISIETIKKAFSESKAVPGRFEHVDLGQKYSVIVDYAHAADSLENLLSMYRDLTPGRLFSVFGATGGGRDKKKRPIMGEMADKYADYIILTDDDPYIEDEWQIIEQVAEGVKRKEGEKFWKIPDRREAIRLALTMASEGDTVVVSGKGCEEVMMVRGKRIEWNDRKVIKELLEREFEVAI